MFSNQASIYGCHGEQQQLSCYCTMIQQDLENPGAQSKHPALCSAPCKRPLSVILLVQPVLSLILRVALLFQCWYFFINLLSLLLPASQTAPHDTWHKSKLSSYRKRLTAGSQALILPLSTSRLIGSRSPMNPVCWSLGNLPVHG